MSVTEAKKNFEVAKAAAENCKRSISELQKKSDILEESLPSLTQQIENAEKAKTAALDNFALHSNKESESELRRARAGYELARKIHNETNELVEATNRALKRQESEFVRLNNASEMAKRECWQAVADEIKTAIPSEVFESIKELQVIGSQTGKTRQWLLDSLFPNIPTDEFQTIRNELCEKHKIE